MSAALALRAAIHQRLVGDPDLGALLNARIYDEVPGNARLPYLVLSGIESRDAGTGTERGEEHRLVLDLWSQAGGLGEALVAASQVVTLLDDAPLGLSGHALANLRWVATDARRTADGRYRFASLRFRAVTEPTA